MGIVRGRWKLWEICGNYGRYVGIERDKCKLWEVGGNYGRFVEIV